MTWFSTFSLHTQAVANFAADNASDPTANERQLGSVHRKTPVCHKLLFKKPSKYSIMLLYKSVSET